MANGTYSKSQVKAIAIIVPILILGALFMIYKRVGVSVEGPQFFPEAQCGGNNTPSLKITTVGNKPVYLCDGQTPAIVGCDNYCEISGPTEGAKTVKMCSDGGGGLVFTTKDSDGNDVVNYLCAGKPGGFPGVWRCDDQAAPESDCDTDCPPSTVLGKGAGTVFQGADKHTSFVCDSTLTKEDVWAALPGQDITVNTLTVGNGTGTITGNVTGNVTGDVTGTLYGNVYNTPGNHIMVDGINNTMWASNIQGTFEGPLNRKDGETVIPVIDAAGNITAETGKFGGLVHVNTNRGGDNVFQVMGTDPDGLRDLYKNADSGQLKNRGEFYNESGPVTVWGQDITANNFIVAGSGGDPPDATKVYLGTYNDGTNTPKDGLFLGASPLCISQTPKGDCNQAAPTNMGFYRPRGGDVAEQGWGYTDRGEEGLYSSMLSACPKSSASQAQGYEGGVFSDLEFTNMDLTTVIN